MLNPDTLPGLTVADLQPGDVLVELANPNTLFGRMVIRFGYADALRKDVPLCQHVVTVGGSCEDGLTAIEAIWLVIERDMTIPKDVLGYVVLRPRHATPEQIKAAIAYQRRRRGRPYGFRMLVQVGLKLAWPWAPIEGDDRDNPICSVLARESYEAGGYLKNSGDDWRYAPWDWLTQKMQEKFEIMGRLS